MPNSSRPLGRGAHGAPGHVTLGSPWALTSATVPGIAMTAENVRTFAGDARLRNPAFAAYHLVDASAAPEQHVLSLPHSTAAQRTYSSSLGYKELKARSLQNALVPAAGHQENGAGVCAYVDADGWVVLVSLDATLRPSFRRTVHLELSEVQPPSLASIDTNTWVACGGDNSLVILRDTDKEVLVSSRARVRGVPPHGAPDTWEILSAQGAENRTAHVLLQRSRRVTHTERGRAGVGSAGEGDATGPSHRQTHAVFDVALVRMSLSPDCQECDADILWDVTGDEPTRFALLGGGSCTLGAEAPFKVPAADEDPVHTAADGAEPAEHAPGGPDAGADAQDGTPASKRQRRLPPYSWTQTDDTVTVTLSLPASLDKRDIRAHFSHRGLSVSIAMGAHIEEEGKRADLLPAEALLREGHLQSRRLWGEIDAAASVWTWEKMPGREEAHGLLTLHLAKAHEGTRWSSVFVPKHGEADDELSSVPETMDPSQLLHALEGLDKYTAEHEHGQSSAGLGSGLNWSGSSSLLQDGLEEEDALSGVPIDLTYVVPTASGAVPTVSRSAPTSRAPLLARSISATSQGHAVLIKHDVDGQLFEPPSDAQAGSSSPWLHTETVPAISYVLASKRDASPVYAYRPADPTQPTVILAIEARRAGPVSSAAQETAGNLYAYMVPGNPRLARGELTATGKPENGRSYVVPIGAVKGSGKEPTPTGTVRGAAVLTLPGPRSLLACLCEHALVLLEGIV